MNVHDTRTGEETPATDAPATSEQGLAAHFSPRNVLLGLGIAAAGYGADALVWRLMHGRSKYLFGIGRPSAPKIRPLRTALVGALAYAGYKAWKARGVQHN